VSVSDKDVSHFSRDADVSDEDASHISRRVCLPFVRTNSAAKDVDAGLKHFRLPHPHHRSKNRPLLLSNRARSSSDEFQTDDEHLEIFFALVMEVAYKSMVSRFGLLKT
jgi:hypothetical protein